jgi:hypothetical protein
MEMTLDDKDFVYNELGKLDAWLGPRDNGFNPSEKGWLRTAMELDALSLFIRHRIDPSYPSIVKLVEVDL